MKVCVKFNIGTNDHPLPPLKEGEQEVAEELGLDLIKRGYADPVAAAVKAVAPAPEITGVKEDEAPKKSKK